jgi:cytochrome c-type biogenesis protein CcmH/NrfG
MGIRRRSWLCFAALALACASAPPEPQSVAEAYLEAGRYVDAAREADAAVRRDPDDPELRMLAAQAHTGAGSHERAIDHLEEVLELAPSDANLFILLGEIEQSRENVEDAYVAFRRATQLGPDEIRAWSGLALSAEALGFEEEAAEAYAEWARLEEVQGLDP